MKRTLARLVPAALLAAAAALAARPVYAHGFGERYDLPIPLGYFVIGAGAAVALSFIVVGMFLGPGGGGSGYPRYNLLAAPALGESVVEPMAHARGKSGRPDPIRRGPLGRLGRHGAAAGEHCAHLRLDNLVGGNGVYLGSGG